MNSRLARPAIAGFVVMVGGCAAVPEQAAGDHALELRLCPGQRVANAPKTDTTGRVVDFAGFVSVRGRTISTAPVSGCLSSGFGARTGGAGSRHDGVDLSTGGPQPIQVAAAGRVELVARLSGYGLTIDVDHGAGVVTRYAHLSRVAAGVKEGVRAPAGKVIGLTGRSGNATGVHLHYEIRIDGRPIDPLIGR